jgi:hypothetical protein
VIGELGKLNVNSDPNLPNGSSGGVLFSNGTVTGNGAGLTGIPSNRIVGVNLG